MIPASVLVSEYIKTIGKFTYDERDCITSIWKILEKYGAKTELIGSNWFARYELRNMRPLTHKSQLYDGCAVLKTVLPGEPGYKLPARYKKHVDLIDYNHIGVGTNDGRILDSTRYGQQADGSWTRNGPGWSTAKIGKNSWDIIAEFEDADYYLVSTDIDVPGKDEVFMGAYATVVAKEGNTVNLRERPSTGSKVIIREYVPVGTVVQRLQQNDDWSQVQTPAGKTGWMMNEFLSDAPAASQDDTGQGIVIPGMVTVSLPEGAANALLTALQGAFK